MSGIVIHSFIISGVLGHRGGRRARQHSLEKGRGDDSSVLDAQNSRLGPGLLLRHYRVVSRWDRARLACCVNSLVLRSAGRALEGAILRPMTTLDIYHVLPW